MAGKAEPAARRTAPNLAEVCGGRDNNLNLIRFAAAIAVMVSHAFPITRGTGALEPLVSMTGQSLGFLAVAIFFVISGFLIARSYDRRVTGWHWLLARILRLFPALIVTLVLTAMVLGPLTTALAGATYWKAIPTWTYVPHNLSLFFLQYPLPGVFEDNPMPGPINGSLWSLSYEVACYGAVFAAGIVGMLRKPRWFALGCTFFLLIYAVTQVGEGWQWGRFEMMMRLALPFSLGMAAYVWRERIWLDWRMVGAVWVLAALFRIAPPLHPVSGEVMVVALGYTTLCLAYRPKGILLNYNRIGDYSYGIYIYAFPLQQFFVWLYPGQSWIANLIYSFPATLTCAILSWHLVEKRALALAKPKGEKWRLFWWREGRGELPVIAR